MMPSQDPHFCHRCGLLLIYRTGEPKSFLHLEMVKDGDTKEAYFCKKCFSDVAVLTCTQDNQPYDWTKT